MIDTNQVIVSQNEFKKFIAPSTLSSQRKSRCHFDRREKSFLDPSHPLGMTGLGPSPWRPSRSLRENQSFPICLSSVKFKYVWQEICSGDPDPDNWKPAPSAACESAINSSIASRTNKSSLHSPYWAKSIR